MTKGNIRRPKSEGSLEQVGATRRRSESGVGNNEDIVRRETRMKEDIRNGIGVLTKGA